MTRNEAEIEVGDTPVIEVESVGVGEEERSVLMGGLDRVRSKWLGDRRRDQRS